MVYFDQKKSCPEGLLWEYSIICLLDLKLLTFITGTGDFKQLVDLVTLAYHFSCDAVCKLNHNTNTELTHKFSLISGLIKMS